MKIIYDIRDYHPTAKRVVATIGSFDGVHKGHQELINSVIRCAEQVGAASLVMTFEGHPAAVLRPDKPVNLICSLKHKVSLLEQLKVENLAILKFSREFAAQTAEQFLRGIIQTVPLSVLILGHDARIGKGQEGDRQRVIALSEALSFKVNYLDQVFVEGEQVSSSRIRQYIQSGDFDKAEKLLGRKYSVFGTITSGIGLGKKIGFPTVNLKAAGLCLPPFGVYAVVVRIGEEIFKGIANLGVAPTVRNDNEPILEVHLFSPPQRELSGIDMEVIFSRFVRPEMKFSNIEDLTKQISKDIDLAKS